MIPIYISATFFTSYIIAVINRFGVLDSISDSFYLWTKPWPFLVFTWGTGFPLLATGDLWLALAGICLCFVGVIPFFKLNESEAIIHSLFAIASIVLALAGLAVKGMYWPGIIAIVVSIILPRLKVKNQTWWTEIACYAIVIVGEWIKLQNL